ncbi:hypothetical protein F5Y07DRAFT_199286 [Xylaria sp. FL0933]|nr:hypothetical protein F5Y07DRAFT_199286 [Xylaria sp. FL0933]
MLLVILASFRSAVPILSCTVDACRAPNIWLIIQEHALPPNPASHNRPGASHADLYGILSTPMARMISVIYLIHFLKQYSSSGC